MAAFVVRQSTSMDSDPASTGDKRIDAGAGSSPPGRTAGRSQSLSRSEKRRRLIPTVIIDKSALFRAGLVHILGGSRFRVTASRSSLSDLSERVIGDKHCVVLISLEREAGTILPQVASLTERGLRVVVLADQFRPEELVAAIEAGAAGYLLKNEIAPDVLVKSLELVLLGGVVIPPGFAKLPKDPVQPQPNAVPAVQVPTTGLAGGQPQSASGVARTDDLVRLSNREQMILELLMQGASNKHIACELDITESTVKVHVKSLLRKIRVNNRTQAAMWGRDRVRPNGQLEQAPASSPTGRDGGTTSETIPNGDETASRSGSRAAAAVGQVLTEIDFKSGFGHNIRSVD
jgi:DNA-binding NarL/FixJ family response regulator